MRTAYSGRAAAYEKKGQPEKALADHNMAVLYYAIEAEILNNLETPGRDKFLMESAQAYRARSRCLESLGRLQAAQVDRKRADGLEADAKQLANKSPKGQAEIPGAIQLTNAWVEPVTLVIDGVTHRLEVGEKKAIPASAASVPYEMQAGPYRDTGTFKTGKKYTIGFPSR